MRRHARKVAFRHLFYLFHLFVSSVRFAFVCGRWESETEIKNERERGWEMIDDKAATLTQQFHARHGNGNFYAPFACYFVYCLYCSDLFMCWLCVCDRWWRLACHANGIHSICRHSKVISHAKTSWPLIMQWHTISRRPQYQRTLSTEWPHQQRITDPWKNISSFT